MKWELLLKSNGYHPRSTATRAHFRTAFTEGASGFFVR